MEKPKFSTERRGDLPELTRNSELMTSHDFLPRVFPTVTCFIKIIPDIKAYHLPILSNLFMNKLIQQTLTEFFPTICWEMC